MGNISGKCYCFNLITPVGDWDASRLRSTAALARLALRVASTGPVEGGWKARLPIVRDLVALRKLSFVHKARFAILPRRGPHRGRARPFRSNYLLFLSNFTTSWDAYVDDIATVAPTIFDRIGGKIPGYNRESSTFDDFKEYIRRNQVDADYYYAAYPEGSAVDVRAALDLVAALREFRDRVAAGPDRLLPDYPGFLRSVQGKLATTAPPPGRPSLDGPAPLSDPRSRGVVALCPLRPDPGEGPSTARRLRDFLADQPDPSSGPLADVGGVHFARFVVVDEVGFAGRRPGLDRPSDAYLLYACDFDGTLDDHLDRLFVRSTDFVRRVWGHCRGLSDYFDPAAFRDHVRRCRLPPLFQVEAVPGASAGAIVRALEVQRAFIAFLGRSQGKATGAIIGEFGEFLRAI